MEQYERIVTYVQKARLEHIRIVKSLSVLKVIGKTIRIANEQQHEGKRHINGKIDLK